MQDGLVLMYVKDGELYPVAVTEEQYEMIQLMCGSILNKKIKLINKSQGKVTNLLDE